MPNIRMVCPHCESSVEIQTTSVTRARRCPACGKNIIMQMASRSTGLKRQALLTEVIEVSERADLVSMADTFTDSRQLSVEPVKRLMHDPEVMSRVAYLKWGGLVIFAMVSIAIMGNSFQWWAYIGRAIDRHFKGPAGISVRELEKAHLEEAARLAEPPKSKAGTPAFAPAKEFTNSPPVQVLPASTDDAAREVAVRFLEATTLEERLKTVRERALNERRMADYYARRGDGPVKYDRIEPLDNASPGKVTRTFNVILKDGSRRSLIAGMTRSGQYLVDWASFVLYGEMEWSDFVSKQVPEPKMFRLQVTEGDYFAGEFPSREEFFCFKLKYTAESDAPPVFGYAPKNSTIGRVIKDALAGKGGMPAPMMLKIGFKDSTASENQVLIHEFIGEGWVARNW